MNQRRVASSILVLSLLLPSSLGVVVATQKDANDAKFAKHQQMAAKS